MQPPFPGAPASREQSCVWLCCPLGDQEERGDQAGIPSLCPHRHEHMLLMFMYPYMYVVGIGMCTVHTCPHMENTWCP